MLSMGSDGQEAAEVILSILLLIMDYMGILQVLTQRAYDKKSARACGIVLAVLFVIAGAALGGMSFAMRSALYMLFLCFAATAFLTAAGTVRFLSVNRGSLRKKGLVCLVCSLFLILGATLFTRDGSQDTSIYMELLIFSENGKSVYWWQHGLLNAVLFIPLGVSLSLIRGREKLKLVQSILVGVVISTFIELVQLFFKLGQCDINDILFNTLGTAAGFVCAELVWKENSDPGEQV